ncbi:hypothetical protein FACS189450_10090 [Spirochaetia bacterium]|nr:hypothetical protein FACS189450_10090 [Spirochaetia bacterium]
MELSIRVKSISYEFLGIKTEFANSTDFASTGTKHEKLLSLVKSAQSTTYISGPAAKDYIIEEDYRKENIEVIWKDYSGYPEYPQRNVPFEPYVSIIDLLFNVGSETPYYIWGWRESLTNNE